MKAAFLLGCVLPPPTPLAFVLAGAYRPRAGLTTNGNVASLVQAIVRDIVIGNVCPNLTRSPVGQGVELDQRSVRATECRVQLNDWHVSSSPGTLVATLPGDPSFQGSEHPLERLDLANPAAFGMPIAIETEETFLSHQALYRIRTRE